MIEIFWLTCQQAVRKEWPKSWHLACSLLWSLIPANYDRKQGSTSLERVDPQLRIINQIGLLNYWLTFLPHQWLCSYVEGKIAVIIIKLVYGIIDWTYKKQEHLPYKKKGHIPNENTIQTDAYTDSSAARWYCSPNASIDQSTNSTNWFELISLDESAVCSLVQVYLILRWTGTPIVHIGRVERATQCVDGREKIANK